MKTENYLVTATEFKEMAVTFGYTLKNGISNSNKANTKSESSAAYYLDENANPWFTYIPNRCPRYQDFVCAPSGLTVTVSTVSVNDSSPTTPIYNAFYTYLFKVKSTVPTLGGGPVVFNITLPNNISLGSFRYVYYNGSPVPLPTSNYYTVDIYNTTTGQVQITLLQPITTEYTIAFNAKANADTGTFTATGFASGPWCATTVTVSGTNSYTLLSPNVTVSKAVISEYQVNCLTVKQYSVNVSNTGGTLIGGTLSDTLPTGLTLDQFAAVYYDGAPVPVPTSNYYNLSTYQEGVNGGQVVLQLFKEIGNGHYYTLFFYAKNNGGTASYTNTAIFQNGIYATSGSNTSSWPTAAATTYYEVYGCTSLNYLYTTIAPLTAQASNRYILPASPDPFYTYTGSTLVQCTVPANYNASLYRTNYYGCCTTTPNWVVSGYTCTGCDKYEVLYDDNPCSPTFGQYQPGPLSQSNSAFCYQAGVNCCGQSTSPVWSNNGATDCFGSCTLYQPQINTNVCYTGSPQTRNEPLGPNDVCGTWVGQNYCQGCNKWYKEVNSCTGNVRNNSEVQSNSTFCGGCCGQSTTPNWQNTGAFNCYGTCNKYNVEQDINNCSNTSGQTRQGSLDATNSAFCFESGVNCCGQSQGPSWVNDGDPYCFDCHLYQPQINNNPCYTGSPQTQDADLGDNTGCGTWYTVEYCANYGVAPYELRSKQLNTCVPGAVRNDQFVANNSPACGYVPPPTCRQYQIVGDYADESVTGIYTTCAGVPDTGFSFFGGPGTVGYICAQAGSVYVTSGNGSANDVGGC